MKNPNTHTYIIRTVGIGGYWAKDPESFAKAARKLKSYGVRNGAKVLLTVVAHDGNAFIDDYGAVCFGGTTAPDATMVCAGVFTLGSALRSEA